MDDYYYLRVLSQAAGWIYFLAWSVSFYPQAILNYQHKSVAGFSIEFAILNVSGFFFYSLYSIGGYVYSHLGTGVVHTNDLVFALHAFFMTGVQLTQVFIYCRGSQKDFKPWALSLLAFEWIVIVVIFTFEGLIGIDGFDNQYNTFRMAGYCKALITMLKYLPQVYLNYTRKSTVGWSIFNIMCDLTGGVFSILQQLIDMVYNGKTNGDWSFFGNTSDAFNVVKFTLGVISIVFDIIFMIQHFILYPENDPQALKPLVDELKRKENGVQDSARRHLKSLSMVSTANGNSPLYSHKVDLVKVQL